MPNHIKPEIIAYHICQITLNQTLMCKFLSHIEVTCRKICIRRDLPVYTEDTLTGWDKVCKLYKSKEYAYNIIIYLGSDRKCASSSVTATCAAVTRLNNRSQKYDKQIVCGQLLIYAVTSVQCASTKYSAHI